LKTYFYNKNIENQADFWYFTPHFKEIKFETVTGALMAQPSGSDPFGCELGTPLNKKNFCWILQSAFL